MFSPNSFTVIAALHLLPFPGSSNPDAQPISAIIDHAIRNTRLAVNAGVTALYFQDLGDYPVAPHIEPHSVAGATAVGSALRREFPALRLGVCLMSHGAREPLAIAQAIGAQFIRLKVYVGAMVKAEGLVQGLAHEAVQYRAHLHAESDIAIFADIYDRTGAPLGQVPLAEEAKQAATFGRADALILTGQSLDETAAMLAEVRASKIAVPLLIGGGATAENLSKIRGLADGVIVSSALKTVAGWSRESLSADWDPARFDAFMRVATA